MGKIHRSRKSDFCLGKMKVGFDGGAWMRIDVHVTPRARRASIDRTEHTRFRVAVTAPPHDGRANEAVIDLLAEYFRVPRSWVRIVRGRTARHKIVEIPDESPLFGASQSEAGSEVK